MIKKSNKIQNKIKINFWNHTNKYNINLNNNHNNSHHYKLINHYFLQLLKNLTLKIKKITIQTPLNKQKFVQ